MNVVLDSNVLYPPVLRDVLLSAAEAGLFHPFWSEETLDELRRNLMAKVPMPQERAERIIRLMCSAFPAATVAVSNEQADRLANHPKDRHVLAAAIAASATVIVTANLRDFPPIATVDFRITATDADAFLMSLDSSRLLHVLFNLSSRLKSPPMTPVQIATALASTAPKYAKQARHALLGEAE